MAVAELLCCAGRAVPYWTSTGFDLRRKAEIHKAPSISSFSEGGHSYSLIASHNHQGVENPKREQFQRSDCSKFPISFILIFPIPY
jgi:hypothetical protein